MDEARTRVKKIMRFGSLSDAEQYIDTLDMTSDQKAAIWLYAWSLQPPRRQRSEADAMMMMVGSPAD